MLEPWATKHKAWKKRVAWRFYQRHDLMAAQHLHATAVTEAENLSLLRLGVPISVVANGVDLPEKNSVGARREDESDGGSGPNVALFLGRIYPVKGLPMLIEAWGQVRPRGWRLHIAGPDESNHRREVEWAVRTNNLADVVSFLGPVNALERERVYSRADLFVLPSYSESFGMAIAEALAHGLPVVTTTGAPWPTLVTRGCGWRVEPTVDRIAQALREATACDRSTLRAMGEKGREYVAAEFGWPAVAQSMITLYRTAMDSTTPIRNAGRDRLAANEERNLRR
jgi:glycosyltransferase involved in cell wall biosynthesis